MKSAIEKILFGDTNHEYFEATEEWKRHSEKSYEIFEEFYAGLTEIQKQQFDKMFEYDCGKEGEMEVLYFKEGFKLGLKLGVEVFLD